MTSCTEHVCCWNMVSCTLKLSNKVTRTPSGRSMFIQYTHFFFSFVDFCLFSFTPVSYTHLDVYKRQHTYTYTHTHTHTHTQI